MKDSLASVLLAFVIVCLGFMATLFIIMTVTSKLVYILLNYLGVL